MYKFEFDPSKSETNSRKHGIDFVKAQAPWDDPNFIEFDAIAMDEPRSLAIGRVDQKIWTAVFTHRGDSIRIISVRRAREKEVALYESESI